MSEKRTLAQILSELMKQMPSEPESKLYNEAELTNEQIKYYKDKQKALWAKLKHDARAVRSSVKKYQKP